MHQPKSPKASSLRIAGMASAGAAIEWYDFFIYATAAALVFPRLFFPPDLSPVIAQVASFSTFAVGFIARPIGGALFGHLGDLRGRKQALVLAMLLMGGATTLIGLLPGYAMIGALAPLLLVILRFVQGLAVGGQWGGAALLAIENAPPGRDGFYGSFVQVGVPLGVALANTVFLISSVTIDGAAFLRWGWRLGFLLSVTLIGVALRMRQTAVDDDRAAPPEARLGSPIWTVLRDHGRQVILAGFAFAANNVCFYIAITYAVSYGTATMGIARETMLFGVMVGSLAMIPMLILCGALSDRYGRRGIFVLGALLSGAWGFALFPLIDSRSLLGVTAAITLALLFVSMMYGPQAALFAELFPKAVRCSGASLGYQIGTVIGGGFAPIIATALFAREQSSLPVSVYLAAMCAMSLVSVLLLGRRSEGAR